MRMERQKFNFEIQFQIEAEYLRKICRERAYWIKVRKEKGHDTWPAEMEVKRLWELADMLERAGKEIDEAFKRMIHQFNVEAHDLIIALKNERTLRENSDELAKVNWGTVKTLAKKYLNSNLN